MSNLPQELNWVEKRAACNLATVFNQICDGVMEDVQTINSVLRLPETILVRADMHSSGTTIFVAQPQVIPRKRLTIGIVEDGIKVVQEWDRKEWKATIGMNNEGRCVLRLADETETELEQWQFRKKALEQLLFVEVERP